MDTEYYGGIIIEMVKVLSIDNKLILPKIKLSARATEKLKSVWYNICDREAENTGIHRIRQYRNTITVQNTAGIPLKLPRSRSTPASGDSPK